MRKTFFTVLLSILTNILFCQDSTWKLLGNVGTTNVNFIGTTDNRPLFFRTNNILSGRIDPGIIGNTFFGYRGGVAITNGTNNSLFGYQAGAAITSGSRNVAVGYFALSANTTGSYNAAGGSLALSSNTTGGFNTANGSSALEKNTTGTDNTASGYSALNSNTTGQANSAHGTNSLYNNTSGHFNNAIGHSALFNNTTGRNNTAVGVGALFSNTTGNSNIAIGTRALNRSQNGYYEIAIGDSALFNNLRGVQNIAVGNKAGFNNISGDKNSFLGHFAGYSNTIAVENTATGWSALYYNSRGAANTAFGSTALFNNAEGHENTAIGYQALYSNTTGYYNTAVGSGAGQGYTGEDNTFLGHRADADANGYMRSMALGAFARVTASQQVRVGTANTGSIGGFVNWSNISDGRFKKNIQQNVPGLDFILQLQPVTYNLDVDGLNAWLGVSDDAQQDNQQSSAVISGFIAQDVEALAKKINYPFSGIDAPKNGKDLYALRYAEFVVPLVKAIQEHQQIILELKQQVRELRIKLGMEPGL
jgi:trimeric autotransporter adhesin